MGLAPVVALQVFIDMIKNNYEHFSYFALVKSLQ